MSLGIVMFTDLYGVSRSVVTAYLRGMFVGRILCN